MNSDSLDHLSDVGLTACEAALRRAQLASDAGGWRVVAGHVSAVLL